MPATVTCIRWFFTIAPLRDRKRLRSISPTAFCTSAWIAAAPLSADTGGGWGNGGGKEKQQALGYMLSEPDLQTMQLVRCAFDPQNISNPDKVFPRPRLCADVPGPYKPHPLETAGIAEIF